jgi:hypothetical protein
LHTSTNDHISYSKPTTGTLLLALAVRMSPAHFNRRYDNVTYVHRLFVRATAASVGCVCAAGEKICANPPYTEEMRYLGRFVP